MKNASAERVAEFYIVDPNLRDLSGHYYEYDSAVARGVVLAGYRPMLLTHEQVDAAIARRAGAIPAFAEDIWGSVPESAGNIRRVLGKIRANMVFLAALLRHLRGATRGSVIFAHTFVDRQFLGLALLPLLLAWKPSLRYVFLLRYQPAFYTGLPARWAFRILEMFAPRHRVRLASDSERLSRELEELTSLPVEVLPIPHVPPLADTPAALAAAERPCRLASLGNARDEKGIFEILDAIRILHRQGQGSRFHFILQCNDAVPAVAKAISAFKLEQLPGCDLIFEALDSDAYYECLQDADVLLLPYWRSIYAARTSGVFMEALSAGKPVIATRDTWMSDQLARHGAGIICSDRDAADLARAIREAAADLPRLAEQAAAGRQAWRDVHNPQSLVRTILRGPEGRRPGEAPKRIAIFYPWEDFPENRSGASRRCNLMVEFLQPHVESIRVLQSGDHPRTLIRGCEVSTLGRETATAQLAGRLVRLIILILSRRQQPACDWIFWQYVRVRRVRRFRRRIARLVRWADVVLLEYPFWMSVVGPLARREGCPVVLTAHDIITAQIIERPLLKRAAWRREHSAFTKASRLVVVSRTDQQFLQQDGLAAVLAPNPTDDRFFNLDWLVEPRRIVESLFGIELPARQICLFVGSKHEPNIVAAAHMRQMARQMRDDPEVGFIVIGSCIPAERAGNFLALGAVAESLMLCLYALADLVLIPLPSGTGASMKTVEAMAAGKPIIGTSVAFRGLDVTAGSQAIVEDDIDRYPDRIRALLSSATERVRLARAARQFVADYRHRVAFRPYLDLIGLPAAAPADLGLDTSIDRDVLGLASLAMASGIPDLAANLAEGILARMPDHCAALAMLEQSRGADRLAEGWKPAHSPEPTHWSAARAQLWSLFEAGDYDAVVATTERLLLENDDVGELHFLLAQSLHNGRMDFQKAATSYTNALARGYLRYWTLLGRARLRRDLGQYDAAARDLARALALHPWHPRCLRLLPELLRLLRLLRLPKPAKGEEWSDRRAELWSLFDAGEYGTVAVAAEQLLDQHGNAGELHFLMAQSLHNGRIDLPRAGQHYKRALEQGYLRYWTLLGIGRLRRDLGQHGAAAWDLTRALLLRPWHPRCLRLLPEIARLAFWPWKRKRGCS